MSKSAADVMTDQVRIITCYKKLFKSPNGKIVLKDLQELFSDRSSVVPGDPYATHANEGAREVYLHILTMIETEVD